MVGKGLKTYPTRHDSAGRESIPLIFEFCHCEINSHFIQHIRLLMPWEFSIRLY
jgi:hypothetical protein